MGSAYPTIAADAVARFQRLLGRQVRFVTGCDEHGEKIALAAEKNGLSPQQHCDSIADQYKSLWTKMDIKYDSFIRTTDTKHALIVKEVLERVWAAGDIYKADYEGWYCIDCEEFKDEKEMLEQCTCPIHRKPCQHRKEGNYFFKLSRYQKEIEDYVSSNECVQPAARRNELITFVKDGLRDFSISRSAVKWGIPIPRDPDQTVYVWFDALNGYLSGLLPPGASSTSESLSSHGWPASIHIIGKDILRFHAVYWPAMLISAGLPLPKMVFGHGFLTKDGLKMGKSLGNVLDPVALVDAYGSDAVRFYFLSQIIFGNDGDFSESRFRDIVNASLANNIGNMLNRTLSLLLKNCEGKLVVDSDVSLSPDHPLRILVKEQVEKAAQSYATLSLHEAVESIVLFCSKGNLYLDEVKPWAGLKKGTDEEKKAAAICLVAVLELVRIAAVSLSPVTPTLSKKVYVQLGFTETEFDRLTWEADAKWGGLKAGHMVTTAPFPLFGRLDDLPMVTEDSSSTKEVKEVKKEGGKGKGKGGKAAAAVV